MKNIILATLLLMVMFSCKKEKDLGPLYDSFVGKWSASNQEVNDVLEITKKGDLILSKGVEHQLNLSVDYLREDDAYIIEGKLWKRLDFVDERRNDSFLIIYNENGDTIRRYHRIINDSGELSNIPQTIYFVRQ